MFQKKFLANGLEEAMQHLIKWERYSESNATREPADKIQEDVPNIVNKFKNEPTLSRNSVF